MFLIALIPLPSMLNHGIVIVLAAYEDIATSVLKRIYDNYRYNRLPREVRFIVVDVQSGDHADFRARVGRCLEDAMNQDLVDEFKSKWSYFEGDMGQRDTRAVLLAIIRQLEWGHQIYRIVYNPLKLSSSQNFLIGSLPRFLRPVAFRDIKKTPGIVSLFLPYYIGKNLKDSYIPRIKSRIPEWRVNGSFISFRIPAYETAHDTRPCPIYKVPSEVIYIIFTMVCRENGDAPLTLRASCRQWRNLVDAKASLWTYHSVNIHYISETRLDGYLDRSKPFPFHVHLAWCDACGDPLHDRVSDPCDCPDTKPILAQHNRIECLRTGYKWIHLLSDRTFRSLKTLTIYNAHERKAIGGVTIDLSHFPVLTRLDLFNQSGTEAEALSDSALNVRIKPGSLPSVRMLRVTTDDDGHWTKIVTACSTGLTSLELGIVQGPLEAIHDRILLPQLQCLTVHYGDRENTDTTPAVHLSTPQLERVYMKRTRDPLPYSVSFDVDAVVQLRASQDTSPLVWPSVHLLQIEDKACLLPFLATVGYENVVLPSLKRVELLEKERMTRVRRMSISQGIAEMGSRLGRPLQVVTDSSWSHKMKGYDGENTCGASMPCEVDFNREESSDTEDLLC